MKYFLSLLLVLVSSFVMAQSVVPNEFLVQLEDQKFDRVVLQNLSTQQLEVKKFKLIYPSLNIYHLILNDKPNQGTIDLDQLRRHPAISHINNNHIVRNRAEPDDPSFSEQWNLNRIKAPEAWDLTTGGVNFRGDDIVVAVIDDGFDPTHEDLIENIWINEAEIPNDNIDNDGNGFIDDVNGVNVATGNGEHVLRTHGTKVCGILGAKGNNGIGVSGINWNIKMMLISGQDSPASEASIVEAYNYARTARKKYNDSEGAEGAFVVATNSSWGIDNRWADDFPIWCEVYNDLGAEGILSIAATSNNSVNVAEVGDMPGTCNSEYLIVVTNTDQANLVVGGFGLEYVDIAAPGFELVSTSPGDFYDEFGGTSGACPQVSGAVGLIYSMPCNSISEEEIIENPGAVALDVKSIILDNAFAIDDMTQKSTSEGLLDLHATLEALNLSQGGSSEGFAACGFTPNPTRNITNFEYSYPLNSDHTISVYNANGQLISEQNIKGNGSTNEVSLDFSNYATGVYIVGLKDENFKNFFKLSKI